MLQSWGAVVREWGCRASRREELVLPFTPHTPPYLQISDSPAPHPTQGWVLSGLQWHCPLPRTRVCPDVSSLPMFRPSSCTHSTLSQSPSTQLCSGQLSMSPCLKAPLPSLPPAPLSALGARGAHPGTGGYLPVWISRPKTGWSLTPKCPHRPSTQEVPERGVGLVVHACLPSLRASHPRAELTRWGCTLQGRRWWCS